MRFHPALVPVLIGTAAAVPAPAPQGGHQRESPQNHCVPGGECSFDMCTNEYKPTEGDLNAAKIHWEEAGAQRFLDHLLTDNLDGWSDQINNEIEGGQAYNCMGFPSTLCSGQEQCTDYSSAGAYYVHVSMANMYSAFHKIHEAIQDDGITNLASGIKEVVDVFGPPPPEDDSFIWALLIGVMCSAAAMAGPQWMIAAPMTGLVGGLNLASGISSSQAETPLDYEHDLESKLGEFYSGFQENLEDTVGAIFGGHLDTIEGFEGDQKAWISGCFANGKLLNSHLVDDAVSNWIDLMKQMIQRGFVVETLKMQEYYVSQRWDLTKKECEDGKAKNGIWMGERCTSIAIDKGASMTGTFPVALEDEKFEALKKAPVNFDYQAAMQNAIDCAAKGGGEPQLLGWPAYEQPSNGLPECFFNLKVKDQDFYGIAPEPEDLEEMREEEEEGK